jgi:heterodisulfide reductase subunit A
VNSYLNHYKKGEDAPGMKKIGIFVCHCGTNISTTVDINKAIDDIKDYSGITFITDYKYLCSEPGQAIIKEAIKKNDLEAVVVASCSPALHEVTFKKVCQGARLNLNQCEMANIREQCAWIHKEKEEATEKAIQIIKMVIEKIRLNESLEPISVPVTKRALVIGGGIAGIQAALDIANSGYEVVLLEKNSSIGGRMAQLSETFPTLDCSQCILTPKMAEVGQHPNIKLLTYAELEEISGYVGNFKAKIRMKAKYVDWAKCTGCGLCSEKCPAKVDSEFNEKLGKRKAIYTPFPQAVPNKPVIDAANCIYFQQQKCKTCEKTCLKGAIDFEQKDRFLEIDIGAIIVATGFELYPKEEIEEYGSGKYKDVINGLEFERMLSASGPTEGKIVRPSDGKIPHKIVFIQCAGSRDPEKGVSFCSKICCMYATKHAMLYKHKVPVGEPYIFYIDIRSAGKGYEEFVQRAQEKDKVTYLRGKVSRVFAKNGKIAVLGVDTLSGNRIEIDADLVVLATPMLPAEGARELATKLKIAIDKYGFFCEAHPKLRPLESLTAGIFLAGACQGPKDIPETVAQASGAAIKVLSLFSQERLLHEPNIAFVNEDLCSGCKICINTCPYHAIKFDEEKKIVKVDSILCEGCGACVAACPAGATQQRNFTDEQVYQMVDALLE